jgi:hypothetical protein
MAYRFENLIVFQKPQQTFPHFLPRWPSVTRIFWLILFPSARVRPRGMRNKKAGLAFKLMCGTAVRF